MANSAQPKIDLHALVNTERASNAAAKSAAAKTEALNKRTMESVQALYKSVASTIAAPLIQAIDDHLKKEGSKLGKPRVYAEGRREFDPPFEIDEVQIRISENKKIPFRFTGFQITFSPLSEARDSRRPVTQEEIRADSIIINKAWTNYVDGDPYPHDDGVALGPYQLENGQIPKRVYLELAKKLASKDLD